MLSSLLQLGSTTDGWLIRNNSGIFFPFIIEDEVVPWWLTTWDFKAWGESSTIIRAVIVWCFSVMDKENNGTPKSN